MTPTLEAPETSSSEINGMLDILNAPEPSQPEAPAVETPVEDPAVEATGRPRPDDDDDDPFRDEEEQAPEPEAAPATEEKTDDDPLVDKPTLEVLLKTPRGKSIYDGYRFGRQLEQPWEKGGIGLKPTVEQIRQNFVGSQNFHSLLADVDSGDPQKADRAVQWLLDPRRPSAQVLESRVVERLASSEQHLSAFTDRAMSNAILAAFGVVEQAKASGVQEDIVAAVNKYNALQHGYKGLFGQFRRFDQQPAQDASLSQREEQLRQREQQIAQQADQQWTRQRDTALDGHLLKRINQALAPVAEAKKSAGALYERTVRDFAEKVRSRIANEPARAAFRQAEAESRRTGDMKHVLAAFESLIVPVIRSDRAQYISEFGSIVVKTNADDRAALGRSAAKTAPGSAGAPVKQSVVPDYRRRPDETELAHTMRILNT